MILLLLHLLRLLPFLFAGHRQLALENLALRHQLAVYKRTAPRPRLYRTRVSGEAARHSILVHLVGGQAATQLHCGKEPGLGGPGSGRYESPCPGGHGSLRR